MSNNTKQVTGQRGFTLLELMITIAIVWIIASIAIPSYIDYTKKTHYSELIRATAPYKLAVVQCYNETGSFDHCSSSNTVVNGIPPTITAPPNPTSTIGKISVVKGVIIAEPNNMHGIKSDQQYILTPAANSGVISWVVSGKAVEEGLTK